MKISNSSKMRDKLRNDVSKVSAPWPNGSSAGHYVIKVIRQAVWKNISSLKSH